jgi:hypothetical protein
MLNRTAPDTPASAALTPTEIELLDLLAATRSEGRTPQKKTVGDYALEIARIGGDLAHGKDPPPGNIVMWRGLSRLTDIHIGFELSPMRCG